jgi:cytochrome c553
MTFNRSTQILALLTLLSGCGDGAKEQAGMPPQAAVEVAAPAANVAAETAGEAVANNVDAATLYAVTCASCHGATAEGVGGFPNLTSLSRDVLQSRLETYRAGKSVGPKSAVMMPIAKKLSDEQIAALASYLGS